MRRNIFTIIVLVLLFECTAFSQESTDTLRAKDNVMFELPTLSVNFGINHLMGDVGLNRPAPSPILQFGYQFTITQRISKALNASFALYTGSVRGEEMRDSSTNVNFRTTLFSQQLSVEYNFYPLLKPNDNGLQLIRPYIGVGVGLLSFRSKGDLKSASGVTYQYWSDGTTRAEVEGSVDPSESTILERDFVYETDLRDANLDGLKKYSQLAFTLPINAGIRFQVSKNVGINAAFTYALHFTDMIDNVSSESVGSRKGEKGFDNQLYGSIGLSVFLGRTKHASKPKRFDDQLAQDPKPESKEITEDSNKTTEESAEAESISAASVNEEVEQPVEQSVEQQPLFAQESASDKKQAQLLAQKQDVYLLKSETDRQLDEIGRTQTEVSKSKRLKKSQVATVKDQLKSAYAHLAEVQSFVARTNENVNAAPSAPAMPPLDDARLATKEGSQKALKDVTERLNGSKAVLRQIDGELSAEESKFNALNVLKAKVRLMEKMQTKSDVKLSMSEEERIRSMNAVLEELRLVQQDTSLSGLVDNSEIEELAARVEKTKLAIVEPKPEEALADAKPQDESTGSSENIRAESGNKQSERKATGGQTSRSETAKSATTAPSTEKASTRTERAPEKKSTRTVEEIRNTPPKLSTGFHWADVNKNGMISPDEVLYFIDTLFEGEGEKTVEDIQNLIDYYFDQE